MTELLRVVLRVVGVVVPGAVVLGLVQLRGGVPDGDFATFLGAMGLSLLAAATWAAVDARRAPTTRVLVRWVAIVVVVGGGLGAVSTITAPGSPPGPERIAEAAWLSVFYGLPLLVVVGLGMAVGGAHVRPARGSDDPAGRGTGI